MKLNKIKFQHLCIIYVVGVFFSTTASSQVFLNIIPKEINANTKITLLIETTIPNDIIEVRIHAIRIDSNNDGIINKNYTFPSPIGRTIIVKDVGKVTPYAKDQDPQLRKIQYRLVSPQAAAEYVVEVKSKIKPQKVGSQESLLVYAKKILNFNQEASILNRWSDNVPKIVLSELYRSLQGTVTTLANQQVLWFIDLNNHKKQLTTNGMASDPQWAPAGKFENWLAYSFFQSAHTSYNIWIIDVNNPENRKQITKSVEDDMSPDSKKLAFLRGDKLIVSNFDNIQNEKVLIRHEGIQELISWDRQTQNIIYSRLDNLSKIKKIWSVNTFSGNKTALTYHPVWGLIRSVSTSNNYNRLLFEWKSRTRNGRNIYAFDFSEQTSINLTSGFNKMKCFKPSLNSNGKLVAFVAIPVN